MELLRHRPLSSRGKSRLPWREIATILGVAAFALTLVVIVQQVNLGTAHSERLARDKIACRNNLLTLRHAEAGFIAVDKMVNKLVGDPQHRNMDAGFEALVSAVFANTDVLADSDYQHALMAFMTTLYEFRGGAANADELGVRADDLLVQGQKAAERTKALIDASLPQGC